MSHTSTTAAETGDMRKRILAAAFGAFTKNGYAGTTTLEIAARAKVSKRDLYALFGDKQAMLVACIESRTDRMQVLEGLPVPGSQQALVSTLVAFATTVLTESTHPNVIAMFRLGISEADRSPEVAQALEVGRRANRRTLAEFLSHAQTGGLIGAGDPTELAAECMAFAWEDLLVAMLLGVRKRPSPADLHEQAANAVDRFLRLHPKPARSSRSATH